MKRAVCVDDSDLRDLITEGETYQVEDRPCQLYLVWLDDAGHHIVCARSRFEVVP